MADAANRRVLNVPTRFRSTVSVNSWRSCGVPSRPRVRGAGAGAAGTGHHAPQPAEVGGGGHRGLGVVVVEHAALDEHHLAAQLGFDGLAPLAVAVEHDHVGTPVDEVPGGGLTEARRAARDEDGLPLEVHQAVALAWSSTRSAFDFSKRPVSNALIETSWPATSARSAPAVHRSLGRMA